MSSFVHTEKEFNKLGKFFKEEIKLDSELTDNIIFNLYQFEIISVNARYEENNPVDIQIYKGSNYEELELLTGYDALKLLDSIKYQAADMKSEILWENVLNVHQKLTNGIIKVQSLEKDYQETAEYEVSTCW